MLVVPYQMNLVELGIVHILGAHGEVRRELENHILPLAVCGLPQ